VAQRFCSEHFVKKILKHQDLWDVKRKQPLCANGPPPEAFIIYDQSSAPSADDYLTFNRFYT
jgi:hypothetical protein